MERFFKLKERNTDVRTELIAGATTFLAMVYSLAVNPSILADAGMDSGAVFTATAVSAAFATLCMAFLANYPIALASGMGLNAYFAYSVCIPMAQQGVNDPWKIALAAVFCEGIVFILLSFTNFREKLVNDIPQNLKHGITAGIGLFITLVGLKGAGVVVSDASTLVALGHVKTVEFTLAIIGFIATAAMYHFKVRGYILYGILLTWMLGMVCQATGHYVVDPAAGAYSLYPDFSGRSLIPDAPYFFDFDFGWVAQNIGQFVVIIFSFFFVDVFDTVGTLVGIAAKGDLLDDAGHLPEAKGALLSDAIGTVCGAVLGTSTVSSYVESSAGVAAGGRTGLASVATGVLFILSLFLSPVFLAIPGFATTPALLWVGMLMMSSVKFMDFDDDIADTVGGFLAVIMMPFTYSIANGIMFAMLAWVVLNVIRGRFKVIQPVMWIAFVLFVFRLFTLY